MAFQNLGFEDPDAQPGYALNWTITVVCNAREYAAFDVTTPQPFEDFEEEWTSNESFIFSFAPFQITAAIFDAADTPEDKEDFEEGWEVSGGGGESMVVANFDAALENFEDFEEEWDSNESFDFVLGATVAAEFDAALDTFEDFEEEWDSNESFLFTLGAATAAMFDTGSEAFENFENNWVTILVL